MIARTRLRFEDQELERQVLERTRWLGCHALLRLVQALLWKRGYRGTRLLGRRSWRGRTRDGGADIAASTRSIANDGATLIQVAGLGRVQRRRVDELRGVLLRKRASFGVVFSAHGFSQAARRAASAETGLPVSLIGGRALARMLIESRIGVRREPLSPFRPRLVVDDLFFEALEDRYPSGQKR